MCLSICDWLGGLLSWKIFPLLADPILEIIEEVGVLGELKTNFFFEAFSGDMIFKNFAFLFCLFSKLFPESLKCLNNDK